MAGSRSDYDVATVRSFLDNAKARDLVKQRQKVIAGRIHLAFCVELYQMQLSAGRYFLHEHPQSASSWNVECIKRVRAVNGVDAVVGHMCRHGMVMKQNGEIKKV